MQLFFDAGFHIPLGKSDFQETLVGFNAYQRIGIDGRVNLWALLEKLLACHSSNLHDTKILGNALIKWYFLSKNAYVFYHWHITSIHRLNCCLDKRYFCVGQLIFCIKFGVCPWLGKILQRNKTV